MPGKLQTITIFYAWQSDSPQRFNRYLIRIALELAARKITDESNGSLQIKIDSDTQDIPGQPPVTDTILGKIRNCNVFVPDLTFVGMTKTRKYLPNPNVLAEYGYALHAKSYEAMMPVMNTAYGPPEKLPFDMGHLRHPIQYSLKDRAPNVDRRSARRRLAESFEAALLVIIKALQKRTSQENLFTEAKPDKRSKAFFFDTSKSIASFGDRDEQLYVYDSDKAFYARLFPTYTGQPRVGLTRMVELFHARNVLCMAYQRHDGIFARNDHGPILISPSGNNTVKALTQGFATGELWGINSQGFRADRDIDGGRDKSAIGTISVERIYSQTTSSYLAALRDKLGLRLPYTLELGAVGIYGCYLGLPSVEFPNGAFYGPIGRQEISSRYTLEQGTQEELSNALNDFFTELYDLVAVSREDIIRKRR